MNGASREKGARGEREVAKVFTAAGLEAVRGGHFQGQQGGATIMGDVHVLDVPLHVEVKHTKRLNLWPAVKQARADSDGENYVVAIKEPRGQWHAVVPLDQFAELLYEMYG